MDMQQLGLLKKTYGREMANRRSPAGDYRLDEMLMWQLILREQELAKNAKPVDEAERLAQEHHVSLKVARDFLARRERERDPLDVARKHRMAAPDPEPAEISSRDEQREAHDLRPYRIKE